MKRQPLFEKRTYLLWLCLFALAGAWRVYLISECQAVYSFDALFRMFHHQRIFISHWLPLPQVPVVIAHKLGLSLFAFQSILAVIAAAGVASAGVAVAVFSNGRAGLITGIVLSALPAHSTLSIVPYQEPMMLLFVSLAMAAWRLDRPHMFWLSGALLALAALCRYEAWIFVAILAIGLVVRGRRRELIYFLPTLLAIGAISIVRAVIDIPQDPATKEAFVRLHGIQDLGALLVRAGQATAQTALAIGQELTWPGVAAAILGIATVRSFIRGIGLEIALFVLSVFLLACLRSVVSGSTSPRMVLLVCVFALPFAVGGAHRLIGLIPAHAYAKTGLAAAATIAMMVLWAVNGRASVEDSSSPFGADAELARKLENLPEQSTVLFSPKWTPLQFGVAAVFANTSRLDGENPRWLYGQDRIGKATAPPDYFVYWSKKGYVIKRLSQEEQELFLADPLAYRKILVGRQGRNE